MLPYPADQYPQDEILCETCGNETVHYPLGARELAAIRG